MSEKVPIIKDRRNWRYALILLVVLVLALLVMEFNNRTSELYNLEEQRQLVGERLAGQEGTQAALETAIVVAESNRAVDQWARESGSRSQEGDYPVVIIPGGSTPTPTPRPLPQIVEKTNLERWLDLFFDTTEP